MFTGIIKATSKVAKRTEDAGNIIFDFELPEDWSVELGQSIAIDGICSTVTNVSDNSFTVLHMPETISKTTSGLWIESSKHNLERALTLQDFIDGHLVQGHVDATTTVAEIEKEDDGSVRITFNTPSSLKKLIVGRGSICVNGVSLTVARDSETTFTVALIPYTLEHTNLGELRVGDSVNLEGDLLARYIVASLDGGDRVESNAKR